ncbi:DinB family protein [Gracilimonas tropica]|uniref:DinB family protein n=1 Tax=Gracilimonas tropica TaxID=454600 RepID=UPI00036E91F9|nr:DinB family protein [Gracilimonas tropica]
MDFKQLFEYDKWANDRIFEALKKLPSSEEQKETERLFSHLLTAQRVWVNRIQEQPTPPEIWPDLSVKEMEKLLNENLELLWQLISKKDEVIQYQNSKGDSFQNSVQEILMHVVIHGQHHRAQIASLLRQSGVTPPVTDFIFFLRTLEN